MVRTTIALAVLAAALLGYILFFERDTLTTRELDRRKGDVLPELVRERLSRIEIQRKGVTTVLERGPDPEAEVELGRWKVVEPFQAEADQDAVDALVGELEWMAQRRRLGGVSAEDRKRFGFDAPRYRIGLGVGRERFHATVGHATPQGDGVYVQGSDSEVAFVVEKSLLEALDHEPSHYHTKELHEGLSALTVQGLRLRDEAGERVLAKRDAAWWIEQPVRARASESEADAIVDALDRLRAKRFVVARAEDEARYGLDAPFFEADVTSKRFVDPARSGAERSPALPAEKPHSEEVVIRIRVGRGCEGHAGERYARADDGAVFCIAEEDLAPARKTVEALRAVDAGAPDAATDALNAPDASEPSE